LFRGGPSSSKQNTLHLPKKFTIQNVKGRNFTSHVAYQAETVNYGLPCGRWQRQHQAPRYEVGWIVLLGSAACTGAIKGPEEAR
jgi:hypothetical protein